MKKKTKEGRDVYLEMLCHGFCLHSLQDISYMTTHLINKPTHGQKKLLESHFTVKRAPTHNRPKSPHLHLALPTPSVFTELFCQVQKKLFILNSRFPSLQHNKLPSPSHPANL